MRAHSTRTGLLCWLVFPSLALAGCDHATHKAAPDMGPVALNPAGSGAMATQMLDPHGGQVALEAVTLAVPPGVLAGPRTLAVQSTRTPAPATLKAVTPVYSFAPDGATFALPLTVSFDWDGKTPNPVIYWSKPGSTSEYEALPTVVQGNKLYAAVTHFSSGLVGSAVTAADEGQTTSGLIDVAGTQTAVYVSANGTSAPSGVDFTAHPITASYWDGAAFQPLTVVAGAAGSGSFTVAAVPPGVYYLQYTGIGEARPTIVVADTQSSPSIDLSQYRIGRPDAVTLAAADVYAIDPVVEVDVTPPSSWPAWTMNGASNIGDTFEVYSPNTGAYIYGSNDGMSDPPPATNNQFLFHWADVGTPFVDLSLPEDAPIFFRMTQSPLDPLVQTLTHFAQPVTAPLHVPALDANNKPLPLTKVPVTLTAVAGATSYDLSFAATQCPSPSLASPKPLAGNPSAVMGIDTQPGGLHRGQLSGTPDLVIAGSAPGATALVDLSTKGMPVANPFPSSWELIAIGGCSYTFSYGAAQISTGTSVVTNVGGGTASVSLAPLVGPAQAAKVDGNDWRADQTLGSPTPTLTWDAPATGTPLVYTVVILKVAGANVSKVARVRTAGNSFVVPAGLLASGTSYVMQLTAVTAAGGDAGKFINALQLPYGTTATLSGLLTTP